MVSFLRPNAILALSGDLGAGKTSFVQGLGAGLGIAETIQSPTFNYLNVYGGGKMSMYHFDLYRLTCAEDFFAMGFEEYFEKEGIVAMEWPERLEERLPREVLLFKFSCVEGGRSVLLPPCLWETLWG